MDVVPYAQSLRSLKRGAVAGAVAGLGAFLFGVATTGGSARTLLGGVLICVGGGGWLGSLLVARITPGDQPESMRRYLRLLGLSSAVGAGCIVLGSLLAS